jgi:hypothetical protein
VTPSEITALVGRLREDYINPDAREAADAIATLSDQLIAKTELATLYAASLRQLEDEADGLRRDAERYRYLQGFVFADRGRRGPPYFGLPLPRPVSDPMRGSVAEHFDAAIDTAISQVKKA